MEYTTTELSKITGFSSGTITSTLSKAGLFPKSIGDYGVKIWSEDSLSILNEKRENMCKKDTISMITLSQKFMMPVPEIRKILENR